MSEINNAQNREVCTEKIAEATSQEPDTSGPKRSSKSSKKNSNRILIFNKKED